MVYSRILGTAASLTHHTNKMCPSISISIYISIMKTVVAPSMLLLVLMMVFISSAGGSSLADDDVHGSSRAGGSGGLLRGIPSASSLTTEFRFFAECLRHSAKAKDHTAKI